MERLGYLEFIARAISHIPDKGQDTIRHYGLPANAHLKLTFIAEKPPPP